jgi:Rrf2 family protein
MKLITRDTDYALRAFIFVARSRRKIISVSTLAKKLEIPKPFLRKILQILHREGMLKASRGYGGGFSLALPADKIYLIDLMRVFQGPLRLNECIFKKRICPERKSCPLKKRIDDIEKYVISKLESITIASLLNNKS